MSQLIKQQPIQAFIDARNLIKEKVQQIEQLFEDIDIVSKNILDTNFSYEIERAHCEWKRCEKSIDCRFWGELLKRGMITNVMTDTARNKYLSEL